LVSRHPQLRQIEAPHEKVHLFGRETLFAMYGGNRELAMLLIPDLY